MLLLEREADRMRSIPTKTNQEKPRSWCVGHIFLISHILALKDRHGLPPVKARLPISRSIVPLEGNQVFHSFKCNVLLYQRDELFLFLMCSDHQSFHSFPLPPFNTSECIPPEIFQTWTPFEQKGFCFSSFQALHYEVPKIYWYLVSTIIAEARDSEAHIYGKNILGNIS